MSTSGSDPRKPVIHPKLEVTSFCGSILVVEFELGKTTSADLETSELILIPNDESQLKVAAESVRILYSMLNPYFGISETVYIRETYNYKHSVVTL